MPYRGNEFTSKTKLAAWNRCAGVCERCRRPIKPGRPEYHHIKLVEMGGDNSLDNCLVVCADCHQQLDNEGMAPVLKSNAVRKKDLNLRTKKGRPMPGTKRSGFRKRMNGTVERRASSVSPTAGGAPSRDLDDSDAPARVIRSGWGTYMFRSLKTERLLIRRITANDNLHSIVAALNDKEHMRYSENRHSEHSIPTQQKYLNDLEMGGHLAVGLFPLLDTGCSISPVGTITCYVDSPNRLVDMGIMILPEYGGHGFGLEAWQRMLTWWLALDGANFQKVEAGHHERNEAMASICRRSGMYAEGFRELHFLDQNGMRHGALLWGKK